MIREQPVAIRTPEYKQSKDEEVAAKTATVQAMA